MFPRYRVSCPVYRKTYTDRSKSAVRHMHKIYRKPCLSSQCQNHQAVTQCQQSDSLRNKYELQLFQLKLQFQRGNYQVLVISLMSPGDGFITRFLQWKNSTRSPCQNHAGLNGGAFWKFGIFCQRILLRLFYWATIQTDYLGHFLRQFGGKAWVSS